MAKVKTYKVSTTDGTRYGYSLMDGTITANGCAKWKTENGAIKAAKRIGHEIVK